MRKIHKQKFKDRTEGPLIKVSVGLSPMEVAFGPDAGKRKPLPRFINALIDTGATTTCVNRTIIEEMGLRKIGEMSVHTVTGEAIMPIHLAWVRIVGRDFPALYVVSAPLAGRVDCLIGRDILESGVFTYDGVGSKYELEMHSEDDA